MTASRKRRRERSSHRDTQRIARRSLVEPNYSFVDLSAEDRRYYSPQGSLSPAKTFSGSSRNSLIDLEYARNVNLGRAKPRKTRYVTRGFGFSEPSSVLICARRQIRREVLHAKKKAGRRGQKRKRFSYYSSVSCRRRK